MDNLAFWRRIIQIKNEGFSSEGLKELEGYAERFNEGKILLTLT